MLTKIGTVRSSMIDRNSDTRKAGNGSGRASGFYLFLQKNRRILATLTRRLMVSVDIDDIIQETLVRALESEKLKNIKQPEGFLIGIAKNVAREEARRRISLNQQLLEDLELENHIADEPSIDAIVDGRQRMEIFAGAIASLPPRCARVFVMKHVFGASHKEISAELGISVSTVEKHVALGLRTCRTYMRSKDVLGSDDFDNKVASISSKK